MVWLRLLFRYRYLQSERNTPENLVYQYDDFYFIPEPYQLVYSHCPEDFSWQLCHPAKSRVSLTTDVTSRRFIKTVFAAIKAREKYPKTQTVHCCTD